MSQPFVGEIRIFGFNFPPRGWALCQGQILPISQNTALFSLLGTNYGGNGTSNFGLPDLQGRVALGAGQGNGLSDYVVGEYTGSENVTVLSNEMPLHAHAAQCFNGTGDSYAGTNAVPAIDAGGNNLYSAAAGSTMNAAELPSMGGNLPHNNMQPYIVMNYCIALQGIFPARN